MQDGSFRRSAGSAMARGVAVVVLAVVVGIVVLKVSGEEQSFESPSDKRDQSPSGSDPASTDPTTPPPVTETVPAATPATTKVLVLNGSETKGAAKTATARLTAAAFQTATPTDTPTKPTPSAVYFVTGFEPMAQQVATNLGIAAKPVAMPTPGPIADLAGAQVVVVIGPDDAPRFVPSG